MKILSELLRADRKANQFLPQYSDGRVRIWCKQHESIDPSCIVSTNQSGGGGGGVMMWRIFGLNIVGRPLNATARALFPTISVHL